MLFLLSPAKTLDSGLYGTLRPLDRLQPYRLEMGTALKTPRGRNLYDWWGDAVAADLAARQAGAGAQPAPAAGLRRRRLCLGRRGVGPRPAGLSPRAARRRHRPESGRAMIDSDTRPVCRQRPPAAERRP